MDFFRRPLTQDRARGPEVNAVRSTKEGTIDDALTG